MTEDLKTIAERLLQKNPDWMAYTAGGEETFRFVLDAQRLARFLLDTHFRSR